VNRRVLSVSLGAAVAVSIVGGYLVSTADDGDAGGDDEIVVLDTPGEVQDPTIGTNAAVQGTPLPLVDLKDNNGTTVTTASLLGRPLIINVWNSTCGPCKRELPAFAAAHADLGDSIRFVGVNTLDTPEVNESFARERGVRYELLRDIDDRFSSEVGVVALPVTLFISPDGTILRQTGVLEEDELRSIAAEVFG
jgi:thiol-disulfide isomerase/thioredoxin